MSQPHEHRIKLTVHVLPATAKRIAFLVDKAKREHSTLGRIVDLQFGVRYCGRVAGAARFVLTGPSERAKQSSTRAKAQNDQAPSSALWAVMKAHAWDSITTAHGIPLMCPPEGPHRFIPVFTTREQAVAWAGSDEHVAMLMPNDRTERPAL